MDTGLIRSLIFTALFFFANWGFITETEVAFFARGGGYGTETGGGGIIIFCLSILMYFFHQVLLKMNSGGEDGFFHGHRRSSLLPLEIIILALAFAINYYAFYR